MAYNVQELVSSSSYSTTGFNSLLFYQSMALVMGDHAYSAGVLIFKELFSI